VGLTQQRAGDGLVRGIPISGCVLVPALQPGSSLEMPPGHFLNAQPSFWAKPKGRKKNGYYPIESSKVSTSRIISQVDVFWKRIFHCKATKLLENSKEDNYDI